MLKRLFIIAALSLVIGASAPAVETWPDYRGPGWEGHADAASLPLSWGEGKNVKWKTAIHGRGWSSPVIWGDQVWFTTADEQGRRRSVICVDKNSGKVIHDVVVFEVASPQAVHDLNSHASPSPVIEAGRVYVHFGSHGTACLDTKTAKVLWRRDDLNVNHQVGAGSSPVLFEDLLIFHADGIDKQFIVALNTSTGKTAWKTERSHNLAAFSSNARKSFCVPVIAEVKGRKELVSVGAQCVYGYDPRTGRELWKLRYSGYSNVFRPVVIGDIAVFSTCYDVPALQAIRLGGTGDVTDTHTLWSYKRSVPNKPSPVLVDGLLYMVNDAGIATCLDAKSGEEVWKQRLGGQYTASLLHAAGRIYFFSQEGKATVIAPGRQFKELGTSELDEGFMASPAVSEEAMYLRTKTHLYRIEESR